MAAIGSDMDTGFKSYITSRGVDMPSAPDIYDALNAGTMGKDEYEKIRTSMSILKSHKIPFYPETIAKLIGKSYEGFLDYCAEKYELYDDELTYEPPVVADTDFRE